ncbi:MAG: COX15/CtaA family protein [Actinobacteria bacterium]|nr:COX15/CtaA family protein [Actinomycetota bacterium]
MIGASRSGGLVGRRERWSIGAATYEKVALAALVTLTVVVFTGAAVRLTGSGLGCSSWPRCTTSSFHPPLKSYSLIEFGNRVFIVLVSAAALAAWVGAYLRRPLRPPRRDLRLLAALLPFGVLVQAIVGGESVLYKLAPVWVMAHYWISMLILIAAFELWRRSRLEPEEIGLSGGDRATVLGLRVLVGWAAVVIVLGSAATAAGPHAGASGTGQMVHRIGWWGDATLAALVAAHGLIVTVLGLATVGAWWLSRRRGASAEVVVTLTFVCLLLAAQGVVGITQYALALPTEIVWVHVVLATLTWIGYVHVWAAAGPVPRRPVGAMPRSVVVPDRRPRAEAAGLSSRSRRQGR